MVKDHIITSVYGKNNSDDYVTVTQPNITFANDVVNYNINKMQNKTTRKLCNHKLTVFICDEKVLSIATEGQQITII